MSGQKEQRVSVAEDVSRRDTDDPYLRTSEVARILCVSPKTVSRWATQGKLPHLITLGGHRRFPAREIEEISRSLKNV